MTLQPNYWKLRDVDTKVASIPPALIHSGTRQGIRLRHRLASVVVPLAVEDAGVEQHSSEEDLNPAPVAMEDSLLSQEEREWQLPRTCSMMDLSECDVTAGSSRT